MSKTELLLQKLLNISLFVTIVSFVLLVIDLLFAMTQDAIDCGTSSFLCTVSNEHIFFKSTLWTLFIIMAVFLIAARVFYTILQRESKLVDVNEYRDRLVKKEEMSFSQTKIYSDIIKTKKSRYSEMFLNSEEEDEVILDDDLSADDSTNLKDTIKDIKLPFFARKKLEESMKKDEISREDDSEEEDEVLDDYTYSLKPTFLERLKNINWLFWKKEKLDEDGNVIEKEKGPKTPFKEKIRNINWLFWKKEELDEDGNVIEKIKDDKDKPTFIEKLKSINWLFWKKEKFDEDGNAIKKKKGPKIPFFEKVKSINWLFWKKEKTEKQQEIDDKFIDEEEIDKETRKSVVKSSSKDDQIKGISKVEDKTEKIDKSTDKKVLQSRLHKGNLVAADSKPESIKEEITVKVKKTIIKKEHKPAIEEQKSKAKAKAKDKTPEKIKEKQHKVEVKELTPELLVKEEKVEVKEVAPIVTTKIEEKEEGNPTKKVETPKPKKAKVIVQTKTKVDIINQIFEDSGLSKNKSNKFLGTFSKVITEELSKNGEVDLTGIGTIITILMPAKEAVNPQTKQKITVPAHHQVRFRFSDDFKNKFM